MEFAPERTRLGNGLTVLCQPNPSSAAVSVALCVAAGSAFETRERAGLAGFTASMLKRGTRRRTKAEIGEVLDFTGADLGAGATRHTATVRAKARPEDLDEILGLVAECVALPSFPDDEVEKLRGDLIAAVREDADDPRQVASDLFRELIYAADHPYSWRLDGTEETIRALDRQELVDFHRDYYAPDRSLLLIVGAVDSEAALDRAATSLEGWEARDPVGDGGFVAALPAISDAPGLTGIERRDTPMPGKSQVDIALGHPGIRRSDRDYYAATVMNMILGRFAMGGRLGRSVREEQGMAYYTYSLLQAGLGPGPFVVRAGVHPGNVDRTIDSVVAELGRMATEPVTKTELDDAKSALVRSVPRNLETNAGLGAMMLLIEQHQLGRDHLERYPGLIEAIDEEAVLAFARRILRPDRYGVAVAGPSTDGADDGG